jgi:hypothetical protein
LFNRFVITFRNEFFGKLFLDLFAKSFFNDRARRFTGSITWNFGKAREAVRDGVPFLCDLFRRYLDLERGNRPGLRFTIDFLEWP